MIQSVSGALTILSAIIYCTMWIVAVAKRDSGFVALGCSLSHVAILGVGLLWFRKYVGSDLTTLSVFGGTQVMLLGTDIVFAQGIAAVVVSTLGSAVVAVTCLFARAFQSDLRSQLLLLLGVTVWEGGVGLVGTGRHLGAGLALFGVGSVIMIFSFYLVAAGNAAKPRGSVQRSRRAYDSTV